jgi:hypothetical protein
MVLDVPLPGIEPWAEVQREPALWHFHFHQTPRLPEALIKDRERTYIRDFVDRLGANVGLFSDDDVAFRRCVQCSVQFARRLRVLPSIPREHEVDPIAHGALDSVDCARGGQPRYRVISIHDGRRLPC